MRSCISKAQVGILVGVFVCLFVIGGGGGWLVGLLWFGFGFFGVVFLFVVVVSLCWDD